MWTLCRHTIKIELTGTLSSPRAIVKCRDRGSALNRRALGLLWQGVSRRTDARCCLGRLGAARGVGLAVAGAGAGVLVGGGAATGRATALAGDHLGGAGAGQGGVGAAGVQRGLHAHGAPLSRSAYSIGG